MHDGVLTLENNASGLSWMNEKSVSGERRWDIPQKMTVLQKFYLIFVLE
jgi:hypothetical protein